MKRSDLTKTIVVTVMGIAHSCSWSISAQSQPTQENIVKATQKRSSAGSLPVNLTGPLTLENAISIALSNQFNIALAQSQIDASKARVTQSKAEYYPNIAPSYRYSNERVAGQPTSTISGNGTSETNNGQISLRMLLYDGGKREVNVDVSKAGLRASEFQLLDTRQTTILNVTVAYYELLRRKALVRVAQSSVERTDTELKSTNAFVEAGTSPRKDILQAQADFDNAKVQLASAQSDVIVAMTSLKNAMSLSSSAPIITPDAPPANPSEVPETRSTSDYMKLAINRRPDLKREESLIDSNRYNVKLAQLGAGIQGQADVSEVYRFQDFRGEDRLFEVSVTYPLFDGYLSRSQVRQAKAGLEQSKIQLNQTRQAIQLEIEDSLASREQARLRVFATISAVKAATENYAAARESQKEGAGTIIDVISAQTQLVTAETNAVQAVYDYYIFDARLSRAAGDNDPYLARGK